MKKLHSMIAQLRAEGLSEASAREIAKSVPADEAEAKRREAARRRIVQIDRLAGLR